MFTDKKKKNLDFHEKQKIKKKAKALLRYYIEMI